MKLVKAGQVGAASDASNEVVETMLEDLRSLQRMHSAAGLEGRVLARLQAEPASNLASRGLRSSTALFSNPVRGWAPAAMAASLLCVFGGGIFVARQTVLVVKPGPSLQVEPNAGSSSPRVGTLALSPGSVPAASGAPAPASAQRKPAYAVPAGHHRGRSGDVPVIQRKHS